MRFVRDTALTFASGFVAAFLSAVTPSATLPRTLGVGAGVAVVVAIGAFLLERWGLPFAWIGFDRDRRGLAPESTKGALLLHPLSVRLRAVTGETVVSDVLSDSFGKPSYQPTPLADLKLGEVALLRRMTTRLERKRASYGYYDNLTENPTRRECESILSVSGIKDPNLSLIRLEQRHLIRSENGEVAVIVEGPPGYSGGGGQVANAFTENLLRDPLLLAAYRKVSLAVDKVVTLEPMGGMVGTEVSYEAWLASLSL